VIGVLIYFSFFYKSEKIRKIAKIGLFISGIFAIPLIASLFGYDGLYNSIVKTFSNMTLPSKYEKYEYLGIATSDTFEIYYTTLPEAQTGKMEIDRTNVKRISLNEEYDEDEEYRIYIKTITPDKISYAIVKKEEDIETKEILEEGEVFLD